MVKRLIGSDTTGTDGSVSIPYAGTGAGVVNLSVETEIDGSIVSETYEVLDCTIIDDNTKSWYYQSGSSGGFTDGVRTFINESGSTKYLVTHLTGGSAWSEDFDYPLCFEFDVNSFTNTYIATQIQSDNQADNATITSYISANCHVKAEVTSTTLKVYINGSDTPSINKTFTNPMTGSKMHIGLRCDDGTLSFSNFRVYPI